MPPIDGSTPRANRSRLADYFRFFQAWVLSPRQTASIVPSSPYLGRLMAAGIDPRGGRVMEFGGGTGPLTRQILATGLPADQLEVVEINPDFARELRKALPGVRILETPAQSVAAESLGGAGGYQCIVSGLPLLAMSKQLQQDIVAEAFKLLRPGGSYVQFTYSPRAPLAHEAVAALDLKVERVGTVIRNMPPATVFRYSRASDSARD